MLEVSVLFESDSLLLVYSIRMVPRYRTFMPKVGCWTRLAHESADYRIMEWTDISHSNPTTSIVNYVSKWYNCTSNEDELFVGSIQSALSGQQLQICQKNINSTAFHRPKTDRAYGNVLVRDTHCWLLEELRITDL